MSEKNENEITVKVMCTKEELIKILEKNGLKYRRSFSLDDYYFVGNDVNIDELSTRAIIARCPIVRYIVDDGKIRQIISFKHKEFASDGSIISQKNTYCEVNNYKDAINLLEAMGYHELINIKENDVVYGNENIEFAIKSVVNGDLMIEIETGRSPEYDSIEKLKKVITDLNIPIENNNYFVKKAEIELNKKLNR